MKVAASAWSLCEKQKTVKPWPEIGDVDSAVTSRGFQFCSFIDNSDMHSLTSQSVGYLLFLAVDALYATDQL